MAGNRYARSGSISGISPNLPSGRGGASFGRGGFIGAGGAGSVGRGGAGSRGFVHVTWPVSAFQKYQAGRELMTYIVRDLLAHHSAQQPKLLAMVD